MSPRRRGRPAAAIAPTLVERRVLERWARGIEAPEGLAERARIVLACADGATRAEVARELATSAHRVGRWCRRFAATGLDGLLDDPRPGARPRIDGALRARVTAIVREGVVSTHAIAKAAGISQPTASRLRHELSLDPFAARDLPASLRAIDVAQGRLAGLFVAASQRVLLICETAALAPLPAGQRLALERPRDAARTVRGQASLRLRRFLRQALRLYAGRLHAIVHTPTPPGPAVRGLVAKTPRLAWHPLATVSSFARVLDGWLAFDGGRALGDPAFAPADDGAVLSWLALPGRADASNGRDDDCPIADGAN